MHSMYAPKHHNCHNQSKKRLLGNHMALSDYRLCRALYHHSPLSQSLGIVQEAVLWHLGQLVLSSVFVPYSSSLLTNWPCIKLVICGIHCLLLLHLEVVDREVCFLACCFFSSFSSCLHWRCSFFAGALRSFSALPLQLLSFFVLSPVATHSTH